MIEDQIINPTQENNFIQQKAPIRDVTMEDIFKSINSQKPAKLFYSLYIRHNILLYYTKTPKIYNAFYFPFFLYFQCSLPSNYLIINTIIFIIIRIKIS